MVHYFSFPLSSLNFTEVGILLTWLIFVYVLQEPLSPNFIELLIDWDIRNVASIVVALCESLFVKGYIGGLGRIA